jgi:hypothetical protein
MINAFMMTWMRNEQAIIEEETAELARYLNNTDHARKRRLEEEEEEEEKLNKRRRQYLVNMCAMIIEKNAASRNGWRRATPYIRPKYHVGCLGRNSATSLFLQLLLNDGPEFTDNNFKAAFALDKTGFRDLVNARTYVQCIHYIRARKRHICSFSPTQQHGAAS